MRKILNSIDNLRTILVIGAVLIACVSLVVSHSLVRDLENEERNKMEIWAEAMKSISNADDKTDLTLVLRVLNGNNTIPVVVLDNAGNIQNYRNIDISSKDSIPDLHRKVSSICQAGNNIRFFLDSGKEHVDSTMYVDIYYDDSLLLKRLSLFPYIQIGVVFIFVVIAIFFLLNMKKVEQNKVWVGLSKETAHQLGTPISSLMAWQELLADKYPGDEIVGELSKDIARLNIVADRFSKIGAEPEAHMCDLGGILDSTADYISRRISNKISVRVEKPAHEVKAFVNPTLFAWVVENLCKNAADAMDGKGELTLRLGHADGKVWVEVQDTGKGIPRSKFKKVFTPGYTTKKRGWGLGLSLSKRIITEYHKGKIFVKSSEIGGGTTFRIEIKDVKIGA